jgi:ABC-type uncharacterized transport system permease subunit
MRGDALRDGLLRLIVAISAALVLTNVLAFAVGVAPREALRVAFEGSLSSGYGLGQILFRATPIVITAVAARLALAAGLFNIGIEGQLGAASLAVGALGAFLASSGVASVLVLPILVVAASLVGAAISSVPALLRARFGASEVIAGIVMNQLVAQVVSLLLRLGLALPGTTRTGSLPAGTRLTTLGSVITPLAGSPASSAFVGALALAAGAFVFLRRGRVAREWTLLAESPRACEFAGIPVVARRAQALVLSGAVAGLVAIPMVVGYKGYAEPGLGAGTGFAGLAAAMMGGESALVTVLAALWFGVVDQAGLALHAIVPKDVVLVVQAATLLVAALLGARKSSGGGAS